MTERGPDSPLESLLKLAGERDQPSAPALQRARTAAQQSWQRSVQRASSVSGGAGHRWRFAAALAAGLTAVLFAAALWLGASTDTPAPRFNVAEVTAVEGEVRLQASTTSLATHDSLRNGDVLETGAGRVALALGGLSLRMDQASRLQLDDSGRVTLLQGRVYVDSGGINARTQLDVSTPAGVLRHLGTQYQVRVNGAHTRVQVREGKVVIARSGRPSVDVSSGDSAEVDGEYIRIAHGQAAFGEDWEWAATTAPGFDIENRPLAEFLAWLAREHGWRLQYSGAALQARAQEIRLHGALQGLEPAGMLERVTLITGVPLTLQQGVLTVGVSP